MKKTKLSYLIGALVVAGLACGNALAGSTTNTFTVTTTVTNSCHITTTGSINFATYDPTTATTATSTGSLTVRCTKGSTGVSFDLSDGSNIGAGSVRNMIGTGGSPDLLPYDLFQPATTTPWTACTATKWGSPTSAVTGAGRYTPTVATWSSTTPNVFTVCGSVPSADVKADTYSDTITATVNF